MSSMKKANGAILVEKECGIREQLIWGDALIGIGIDPHAFGHKWKKLRIEIISPASHGKG